MNWAIYSCRSSSLPTCMRRQAILTCWISAKQFRLNSFAVIHTSFGAPNHTERRANQSAMGDHQGRREKATPQAGTARSRHRATAVVAGRPKMVPKKKITPVHRHQRFTEQISQIENMTNQSTAETIIGKLLVYCVQLAEQHHIDAETCLRQHLIQQSNRGPNSSLLTRQDNY